MSCLGTSNFILILLYLPGSAWCVLNGNSQSQQGNAEELPSWASWMWLWEWDDPSGCLCCVQGSQRAKSWTDPLGIRPWMKEHTGECCWGRGGLGDVGIFPAQAVVGTGMFSVFRELGCSCSASLGRKPQNRRISVSPSSCIVTFKEPQNPGIS